MSRGPQRGPGKGCPQMVRILNRVIRSWWALRDTWEATGADGVPKNSGGSASGELLARILRDSVKTQEPSPLSRERFLSRCCSVRLLNVSKIRFKTHWPAMYIPPAFREEDTAALHEMMRRARFATLVNGTGGEIQATHLPLLLDSERGALGTLRGHVARANPQWRQFVGGSEALAIFLGPHAYVSPNWYETALSVPTWNYVAVHAYGTVRYFDDTEALTALLRETVRIYEYGQLNPWDMDALPVEFVERLAGGIVGFEIEITRLEGKWKLGQNRSEADRRGVAQALSGSDDPLAREVARLMGQS